MGYLLQQSSTARPLLFLMIDSSDHISGKTGLSPTVTISKNGAAFGSPAGAVTELSGGWYKVAGNATDNGTTGPLLLHATATGADPCDEMYEVVAFNPDDAVRLGLTAIPNAAANADGGLPILSSSGTTLNYTISTVTTYTGNTPQTGDSYAIVNNGTHGNAAIKGYVDDIGTAGAGLTNMPWNPAWDAEVQSECADALTAFGVSTLTQTQVTGGAYTIQSSSCVLGDARIANLDAAVTSRMATYTQPTGFLAATFPSDPADQSLIIAATDALLTAVNLKASQASVDDLPTNSELTTALAAADDATLAAIAALNNLSTGQVNAQVAAALATYDPPTNAEMEARTLVAATYATAAALASVASNVSAVLDDTGSSGVVVAGTPDVNVAKVNNVEVVGSGVFPDDPWGPA